MKKFLFILGLTGCSVCSHAQVDLGKYGQLSGSLESNRIIYVDDKDLPNSVTDTHFGSNNYLKIDYTNQKFSAGFQLEGYFPTLQGYDMGGYDDKHSFILGNKYISWQDKYYGVRAGDIFDQFGSGLIFRSYEDRQLGFNNSLEGGQVRVNLKDYVKVRGMYGRPRLYMHHADSWVGGADLSLSLTKLAKIESADFSLEGSYVNRHESVAEALKPIVTTPNLNMYSARANFDWNGVSARVEYVNKSKDLSEATMEDMRIGYAWLGEVGYNYKQFSALGTFRVLKHMNTMLTLEGQGTGNVLNYLPALTRQYTYMLANLNPYQVNVNGEAGGQIDAYYSIRPKGQRSKYWNFHANYSTYYSDKKQTGKSRLLWRDVNGDIEHQWNKKLKTSLLVSVQEWSPTHGSTEKTYASNIFVYDMTYKFDRKTSIRGELQYLYSEDYEKDWMAALIEVNFAPHWSVSVSDMYNHGKTEIHYYNGSVSYTFERTRIQVNYGRNRAGYVCSGGVCRYTPAYTGAGITLTTSF